MSTTYLTIGKLYVEIRQTVPDGFAVDIWESDDFLLPKNRKLLVALTGSESQKIVAAIVKLSESDVTPKPPQPQPVPTLAEAVEALLQCSGLHVPSGSGNRDAAIIRVELALTRHKEREKLVDELFATFDECRHVLPGMVLDAIDKIDAFDKGAV